MKVVVAIDSFKGSMTSMEAGGAARRGILRALPDAEVRVRLLADGGEGTTEALVEGLGGAFREVGVEGPLGDPVRARYGVLRDGRTAVMEMAQAAGFDAFFPIVRGPIALEAAMERETALRNMELAAEQTFRLLG